MKELMKVLHYFDPKHAKVMLITSDVCCEHACFNGRSLQKYYDFVDFNQN